MKCNDCKYADVYKGEFECMICHRLVSAEHECEHEDLLVPDAKICYNCKNWIGGGDWGLSCTKYYSMASTNGFKDASNCVNFKVNL